MKLRHIPILFAVLWLSAGCSIFSIFSPKTPDYKGAQARAAQPLEVPPELSAPTMDDRYSVPDPRAQTTYSSYAKSTGPAARAAAPAAAPASTTLTMALLPKLDGGVLQRFRDQRWLVGKGGTENV